MNRKCSQGRVKCNVSYIFHILEDSDAGKSEIVQ
jgi:hypothetical protein